ncbi:MAG: hypothetical protein HYS12_27320 [Planctomycetes bacterium]|nr:hypothetical protein [Planctomycetota bacterium]
MTTLPLTRIVLYKHGVGHFEREGSIEDDATLSLTFKQAEVSDVLKSLTVLDLDGGHIASVSYDSTKPLEQLLAEVALSIPDQGSLIGLLPQLKGARVAVRPSARSMAMSNAGEDTVEGALLGVDDIERESADGIVRSFQVSLLTDAGEIRAFDLHALERLAILDPALRRDLEYYLRTQLSAKKKDTRTFTFFAQGRGKRTVRLSYTLEAPVWKATYRIILGRENRPPMIQGWAVVDNTEDEDWNNVQLSLVAGLPVSFQHDLYTPRYIRRPVVSVKETTGVLPPAVEEAMPMLAAAAPAGARGEEVSVRERRKLEKALFGAAFGHEEGEERASISSVQTQVRERKIGDLFEYEIEHPVTIQRNQSALVPIVLRPFEGNPVLLYNKKNRADNPMRCIEFKNTTGLTLEGGPVTVLESGNYVGEAMLETMKPDEQRLVPYAVDLGVHVLDNVNSNEDRVHRVLIRQGQLRTSSVLMRQTTYTINNKSRYEQTLYLEHPREHGEWELFDTIMPQEITEHYWRFQLKLPPQQVVIFPVKQRFTLSRSFGLAELASQQLAYWQEQHYLDVRTGRMLQQMMELRQQSAALQEQVERLQKESQTIHKEQERIRGNLQALGDRPAEKELRDRLVRTLAAQEDRLEQINVEINDKVASAARNKEKMAALLERLEYEAEV